jgi:hypothetical protein
MLARDLDSTHAYPVSEWVALADALGSEAS